MKKISLVPAKNILNKCILMLSTLLFTLYAAAQDADKKIDVDINTKSDNGSGFFAQPWVWIVGGAVFLLLLVALMRNNNSKNA